MRVKEDEIFASTGITVDTDKILSDALASTYYDYDLYAHRKYDGTFIIEFFGMKNGNCDYKYYDMDGNRINEYDDL